MVKSSFVYGHKYFKWPFITARVRHTHHYAADILTDLPARDLPPPDNQRES